MASAAAATPKPAAQDKVTSQYPTERPFAKSIYFLNKILNLILKIPETTDPDIDDLYSRYKRLQQQLEFLEVQEEYIKDEQRNLKKEYLHAQEEVKRIQSVPLVIGQFLEAVDQNTGIVGSTTGSNYYVRILSTLDRELLKPSASVALHKHSNALVDVLPPEADSSISMLQVRFFLTRPSVA